jgi:hypothetical protein
MMLPASPAYDVATVAERCRQEMRVRSEVFAPRDGHLPPTEPREADEAIEEMAEDLATIDSPIGAARLRDFLDRLLRRELVLQAGSRPVHCLRPVRAEAVQSVGTAAPVWGCVRG